MNDITGSVGARVRELRLWRNMSLRAVAELAGCSAPHLSRLENGQIALDSRALVDGLAYALRVSPGDIWDIDLPGRDPVTAEAHEGLSKIGVALSLNRLGHPYREEPSPWPAIASDLRLLVEELHPRCDYVGQTQLLPDLLERLYTAHVTDPAHRRDALVGLMFALRHTGFVLKNLGAHGLPALAAMHMRLVADELDDPAWTGAAEWQTAQSSAGDRDRMLTVSLRAAEQLQGSADQRARQVRGMLHLNAALASATKRRPDDARAHLAEAHEMVQATEGAPDFANFYFGAPNWTVWRVSVGVDLGEGPKVAEFGRDLDPSLLPSAARRASFFGDVARGLAQERRTRDKAVMMIRAAEEHAPQWIRTNAMMRETVRGLMQRAKQDAVGRELRGLAYRMGLAL